MRSTPLCFLALALALPLGAAPLTMSFDLHGPSVSGATPSGVVAWLGVARVPLNHLQDVSTVPRLEPSDAAGTASLSLDAPAPPRSLWLAVDVANGAMAAGTPASLRLVEESFTTANLLFSAPGKATGLVLAQRQAEVMLVRPGTGAWAGPVTDGTATDADGTPNRRVALALQSLKPLGSIPPPSELQAGDVLVVIDPARLTYRAATLTPSQLAGEGR